MFEEGESVPSELSEAIVLFPHGARKRVRDFWNDKRTLFIFLRHMSCPGCSEQIAILSPHLPELREAGVRVVLVATSAPPRIPAVAKRQHPQHAQNDVLPDPPLAPL